MWYNVKKYYLTSTYNSIINESKAKAERSKMLTAAKTTAMEQSKQT